MENRNTSAAGRGGIVNSVKHRAAEQLTTQKGRATDGLDALAQAVRQSTDQLRTDRHDTVAQYVDGAADQLQRFAATLRDKNVEEIVRDVQDLARRQPALVIGGSFVVGMLAARFLKSSQQSDEYAGRDDYEGGEYGTTETWTRTPAGAVVEPGERF